MVDVVILSLAENSACGCGDGSCGLRTPVLSCRDALRAAGAEVSARTAHADDDIDGVLDLLPSARLVVAAASDGQLRAVVRRLVRRYAPAPSSRPADLPDGRTVPDLPPIGVLPLAAGLVERLGLPSDPTRVAAAAIGGDVRRLDLLRTDAGSVTLDGALVGGTDDAGRAVAFRARVEVDDAVLSDGSEPLLVAAVGNGDGYATFDGLPLFTGADSADGVLDVAVAIPRTRSGGLFGRGRVGFEVRRARGRAAVVAPRDEVPFVDDGVAGTLGRRRTWWIEPSALAIYEGGTP